MFQLWGPGMGVCRSSGDPNVQTVVSTLLCEVCPIYYSHSQHGGGDLWAYTARKQWGWNWNPGHTRTRRNMSHVVTLRLICYLCHQGNFKGELVLWIRTCEFRLPPQPPPIWGQGCASVPAPIRSSPPLPETPKSRTSHIREKVRPYLNI